LGIFPNCFCHQILFNQFFLNLDINFEIQFHFFFQPIGHLVQSTEPAHVARGPRPTSLLAPPVTEPPPVIARMLAQCAVLDRRVFPAFAKYFYFLPFAQNSVTKFKTQIVINFNF
jgi:hypothetical protein